MDAQADDPQVVAQLMSRRRDPLDGLTAREREVLALMAEGRSNAAVAKALVVTHGAVEKHSQFWESPDMPGGVREPE